MGWLQDAGGSISRESKRTWKKGKHWVQSTWSDTGDFIDRKTPEFHLNVDANIDHNVQIDKENFNVDIDSQDIANAGAAIGTGLTSGLGTLGSRVGNALDSFGENLSEGLEKLGEQLGESVQQGLDELGNDISAGSAQISSGIMSHGGSIERASVEFGRISTGMILESSKAFQNGLMQLGKSLENFDATGGLGRHLLTMTQYSQAAGMKLLTLDRYFSRVAGENVFDTFLLKVENGSAKPLPGFEFLTNVKLRGIGGTEYQRVRINGSPTNGRFTLTFNGQTTSPIQWNASAERVQDKLENLSSIGIGNVACFGENLPNGTIDVVFVGLSGTQPAMTATDVGLNNSATPLAEKIAEVPERTVTVRVGGDPTAPSFVDMSRANVVTLGPFAREFGMPYVAEITVDLIPSEQKDTAKELSRVARNDDGSGMGTASYPVNVRLKAAGHLNELGLFAWGELTDLKDFIDNAPAEEDGLIKKAVFEVYQTIKSFRLEAVATVVLSTGEVLEPVAMLKSNGNVSGSFGLQKASPKKSRLPIRLSLRQPQDKRVEIRAVNSADLPEETLSEFVRCCSWQATGDNERKESGSSDISLASVALVDPCAELRRTVPGFNIRNFNDAIAKARELGHDLREFIPPDQFHNFHQSHGVYDIVREMLEPTFRRLRTALLMYKCLTPHFDTRFEHYATNNIHDPALSHCIGVELLNQQPEDITLTVAVEVLDYSTSVTESESFKIMLNARDGETLFPIPLRFADTNKKKVTVKIVPSAAAKMMLTHFSGLVGEFDVADQVLASTLSFDVQRLVV